jgi:hypothetical protein
VRASLNHWSQCHTTIPCFVKSEKISVLELVPFSAFHWFTPLCLYFVMIQSHTNNITIQSTRRHVSAYSTPSWGLISSRTIDRLYRGVVFDCIITKYTFDHYSIQHVVQSLRFPLIFSENPNMYSISAVRVRQNWGTHVRSSLECGRIDAAIADQTVRSLTKQTARSSFFLRFKC